MRRPLNQVPATAGSLAGWPIAVRALDAIATLQRWPLMWRLAFAIAIVVAAAALRLTLLGELGTRLAYVTLYPAVTIAALVSGFYGGVLATIAAGFLAYLLVASLGDTGDVVGLETFLVSGLIVAGMAEILLSAGSRLAAAEASRQRELDQRYFIDQAPVAIAMFDREMRYLAVSARWKHDYHLEQEDLVGRLYYDVFPNIPEQWKEFHRRGLAGEVLQASEDRFARPDGSVQWLHWKIHPWYGSDGDVGAIILFTEDITDRKRAQLARLESEARYRAMVDTAIDSIVVIDESGIIQSANPATQTIFACSTEELVGLNIKVLMPEEHARAHDDYLSTYKRTGIRKIIGIGREVSAKRKDGSTFPVDLAVAEWHDAAGRRFYTGIMRDISERKKIEEALSHAQRLDAVGRLAGGVAHDLNNLLAVIAGNLEVAEQRTQDPDTHLLIQRAMEAVEAGSSFNRRLLSLAQKRKFHPYRVALNASVAHMVELLKRTLSEDVELNATLAADLWDVHCDPGEIDGALLNLAINARDAMPDGGRLEITARNVTFDARASKLHPDAQEGDYVQVSVVDTGIGMAPEVLKRAMDPFFTTKDPSKGAGLGLSSVYNFVKQSGGFVTLSSERGEGTAVNIYLPRALDKPVAKSPADPKDVPQGDGELILVVEDDDRVREITLRRLESLGYAVAEARSGPEANRLLNAGEPIDLVFSDVVMPGKVTGYDVAQWVATMKPNIKVVLTTGYDSKANALPVGVKVPILDKPYTRERLAQTMRSVLRDRPA